MFGKNLFRSLTCFVCLIFLLSIGCVFADWHYSTDPAQEACDQAIWTFVGDEATAYPDARSSPVYYQLKPQSAGNRTVKSSNPDCTIKVYNSNGQVLATSTPTADGGVAVTWSGGANTLYYLSLEGSMSMHFTVQ